MQAAQLWGPEAVHRVRAKALKKPCYSNLAIALPERPWKAEVSADQKPLLQLLEYLCFGEQRPKPPEGATSNGAASDPLEPVFRLHLGQSQGR